MKVLIAAVNIVRFLIAILVLAITVSVCVPVLFFYDVFFKATKKAAPFVPDRDIRVIYN